MKNFLIIGLLGFTLFSCKPETKVEDCLDCEQVVDVTVDTISVETEEEPQANNVKVKEERYWSSSETKLPRGVVYAYDCSNRNRPNQKIKDNYVTIKRTNGYLTIVKDIDEDLFLNIEIGDVID